MIENLNKSLPPVGIGIDTRRHLGRDCRDPEAKDGLLRLLHPCNLDSGNPCRNDGNYDMCRDTLTPLWEWVKDINDYFYPSSWPFRLTSIIRDF